MIRVSFIAALLAAVVALPASAATDYTDTWWTPSEPGWGINLTQQDNFIFGTFFVYGPDGKAAWLTAQMLRDGADDRFTGSVYRTTGTWFGAPAWQGYQIAPVGTATFTATSSTSGTLVYSVEGTSVSKAIERQLLAPLNIAGVYIGGVSGRRSGCATSGTIVDFMLFDVLHSSVTNEVRIDQISSNTGQVVCTMVGTTVQRGRLLTVDPATYACVDGWLSPARIFNLRPTSAGFEGQWFSDGGNGCSESGQFSGARQ